MESSDSAAMHGGAPGQVPMTKEAALAAIANLLASTLEGEASAEDVQRALNTTESVDCDDGSGGWRVRVAECVHRRTSGAAAAGAGPSPPTLEWVCPMCETVNWAADPRKALRRRHDDGRPADAVRCACCGYGGSEQRSEE